MFIMEYKKITYFFNFLLNKMKLFVLYLSAILFTLIPFVSIANNIRQDIQNKTNSFDSAITSYSQYLQNI